jgi:hypothetical protein
VHTIVPACYQRFYRSFPKDPKPGLERNRRIHAYSGEAGRPDSPRDVPDGWYLNDSSANRVWATLEEKSAVDSELNDFRDRDPLRKIDESAHRLRTVIENFETDDQQFLLTLLDILDDESFLENFDEGADAPLTADHRSLDMRGVRVAPARLAEGLVCRDHPEHAIAAEHRHR